MMIPVQHCWKKRGRRHIHGVSPAFSYSLKDDDIYMATGKKEREANFFAADFLIADEEVIELMKTCDANFFNVAKALSIPAPFFAFKLYSMVERGYAMHVPVDLDSAFLAH